MNVRWVLRTHACQRESPRRSTSAATTRLSCSPGTHRRSHPPGITATRPASSSNRTRTESGSSRSVTAFALQIWRAGTIVPNQSPATSPSPAERQSPPPAHRGPPRRSVTVRWPRSCVPGQARPAGCRWLPPCRETLTASGCADVKHHAFSFPCTQWPSSCSLIQVIWKASVLFSRALRASLHGT